jgi:hypothetical protein
MTWLDAIAPTTPESLTVKYQRGYTELSWKSSEDNDKQNAPYYVIYASNSYPVDTDNPDNIIAQRIRSVNYVYAPVRPWDSREYFAISAVDRYGNESKAVQMKSPL